MINNACIHSNNLVTLNGCYVGRIDQDSYVTPNGTRGKTMFYSGKRGAFNTPHYMASALYVPATPKSVSDWKVNPAFIDELKAILDRKGAGQ